MVIRVLIADDHSVVREGLRVFLQRDPELSVVGAAADALAAANASPRPSNAKAARVNNRKPPRSRDGIT